MLAGLPLPAPALRVLGALMEKEVLTPDLYPLSLNALQAACNQRSSRDPVLDLSEDDLRAALHTLQDLGLASPARPGLHSGSSRVSRFEQHARTVLHLRRDEFAVLCLLILRGPQTPGELRARADRLYSFPDLDSLLATLQRLAGAGEGDSAEARPLVQQLARQPGAREARFTHLLGAPAELHAAITDSPLARPAASPAPNGSDLLPLIQHLAERVSLLERRLEALEGGETSSEPHNDV